MKKLFTLLALIILIIIAVPLINSKDSSKLENINFNNLKEIEKNISALVKEMDLDFKDKSKIINALPDLKWDKLQEEVDFAELKDNIVEWIGNIEIKDKEEIDSLIKVSSRFNDEDYTKILEKLSLVYGENMDEFIKALFENKDRLIDLGYSFYDLELYETNGRSISEDFLYIRDSEKLSEEEKQLGYEFLEIISSCGIWKEN